MVIPNANIVSNCLLDSGVPGFLFTGINRDPLHDTSEAHVAVR